MLPRVLLAVLLLATWRGDGYASPHTVNVCGEHCSSGEQCVLGGNLSCNSTAVTLDGGADLDFKGFTITCNSCGAASAVLVTGSNSTIEDTVGEGGTTGAWGTGINCQYQSNSVVKNVHVWDATTGIDACRKVQNNVITFAGTNAIRNTSIGASDFVKDNYIIGGSYGIYLNGSGSGLIDHNNISSTTSEAIHATGTASSLDLTGNMLFAPASGVLIATGTNLPGAAGNVCGTPAATACASCISAGMCEAVDTPFVGP